MADYTKVNVKKELVEKLKVRAAADNRSLTNYLEQLILKDLGVSGVSPDPTITTNRIGAEK